MTVAFLTAFFTAAIIYPLYFKIRAGKAKGVYNVLGIPFVLAIVFSPEFRGVLINALTNFAASPVRAVAAGLLLLCLSYLLSLRIYRTRDL